MARLIALLLLACAATQAAPPHHERYYQRAWCDAHGGRMEVVLSDRTRVDCVTATHAVEVDFGAHWAESIGQSLYYALHTGLRGGVVLIVRPDEYRYWLRLNTAIDAYRLPLDTWMVAR